MPHAEEHLKLSSYDFFLPDSLIAQEPSTERDQSRLMVLERETGAVLDRVFSDIASHLVPGDLLVLNDTRVFPCRLSAQKPGGGKAEIFLIAERGLNLWEALVKGAGGGGKRLHLPKGVEAEIVSDGANNNTKEVRFHGVGDIRSILATAGKTPLPPYIKREPTSADRERYQTVYAVHDGAVAAPTAGLHFTPELLKKLRDRGIQTTTITLHVGPGTFQPVRAENITGHRMMSEEYRITPEAAVAINLAACEGRRIIAVGTTSVRTLESAAGEDGAVRPGEGASRLFIYPGFSFRVCKGLITNFHLPKSTLLMLVSAFAGRDRILNAYRHAVEREYRFYSYGDAMLIL